MVRVFVINSKKECDILPCCEINFFGFILYFSFRNAHSALSWVLPLGVKSKRVSRPITITAACRTKPSTLKTWPVASTSEFYF